MPSIYIILEKQIPKVDIHVNGNFLSKNNDELGRMTKRLGVRSLMEFFSVSNEELSSLAKDNDANFNKSIGSHQEKWFSAEEGLRTVNAILQELSSSKLDRLDRIEAELREFVKVLELAKANGVCWHLGIDY